MTHDELLARLWEKRNSLCDNLDVHFALSAVVELCQRAEDLKITGIESTSSVSTEFIIQTIEQELV